MHYNLPTPLNVKFADLLSERNMTKAKKMKILSNGHYISEKPLQKQLEKTRHTVIDIPIAPSQATMRKLHLKYTYPLWIIFLANMINGCAFLGTTTTILIVTIIIIHSFFLVQALVSFTCSFFTRQDYEVGCNFESNDFSLQEREAPRLWKKKSATTTATTNAAHFSFPSCKNITKEKQKKGWISGGGGNYETFWKLFSALLLQTTKDLSTHVVVDIMSVIFIRFRLLKVKVALSLTRRKFVNAYMDACSKGKWEDIYLYWFPQDQEKSLT